MELNQLKLNQLKQLAAKWNVQPTGDKRKRQTWIAALEHKMNNWDAPAAPTPTPAPVTTSPLTAIQSLKKQFDNYIPMFEYRAALAQVSREEQDAELYKLQRQGKIELSSIVEAVHYTNEQLDTGIEQRCGCCLFFISLN